MRICPPECRPALRHLPPPVLQPVAKQFAAFLSEKIRPDRPKAQSGRKTPTKRTKTRRNLHPTDGKTLFFLQTGH
jgi:hypothetical protein